MESSSSLPEPYESSESSDKKEKKDKDSKATHGPLRVPLSADALHGVATSKEKRAAKSAEQIGGILPIIPKPERSVTEPAAKAESPAAATPASHETIAPPHEAKAETSHAHPELEDLHDTLWQDFDAAPSVPFDTEGDRHAAAESAARKETEDDKSEDEDEDADTQDAKPATPASHHTGRHEVVVPKETLRHPEIAIPAPEPAPDAWHESHTLHLNESELSSEPVDEVTAHSAEDLSEDRIAAGPSVEAMAAEVAATEPDTDSIEALERAYTLPAAELPVNHPETVAEPLSLMTDQEQFQDVMQRADFDESFVRQRSVPRYVAAAPMAPNPAELAPDEPVTTATVPLSSAANPAQWYTAAQYANRSPGPGFAEGMLAGGIAGVAAGSRAAEHGVDQAPVAAPIEQPALITNEQSTVLPISEQYRPVAAAAEAVPQHAQGQQLEQTAGTSPAAVEAMAAAEMPQVPEARSTHVVESAWHRVEVQNGSGRIVEGQPEGRALQEEKSVEAGPPDTADDTDTAAQQQAAQAQNMAAGSMYQQALPDGVAPLLSSGQIGYPYELGSGQIDEMHRLEAPRSPIITALTSPLLWVGIVVLLLAFFAAAFL